MSRQEILFRPESAPCLHRSQVEASIRIDLVHDAHLVFTDEGDARGCANQIAALGIYAQVILSHIETRKMPSGRESPWDPASSELHGSAVLCAPAPRHHKHGVVSFDGPQQQIDHGEHVHAEVDQGASAADARVKFPHASLLGHSGFDPRDEGVRIERER